MINYTLPVLAYLVGSISSAIIVCRMMRLPDPRDSGSNNPGATNVLRVGGKKAAVITLTGDILKGLIPVLVAAWFTSDSGILTLVGLAAFLGHLYPLFFRFKGGKGVATAVGVFIGISWSLSLVLFAIWLIVAVTTRYSSLAALTASALAPLAARFLPGDPAYVALAAIISIFLFWRHKTNISRLLNKTESKIKLTSK